MKMAQNGTIERVYEQLQDALYDAEEMVTTHWIKLDEDTYMDIKEKLHSLIQKTHTIINKYPAFPD